MRNISSAVRRQPDGRWFGAEEYSPERPFKVRLDGTKASAAIFLSAEEYRDITMDRIHPVRRLRDFPAYPQMENRHVILNCGDALRGGEACESRAEAYWIHRIIYDRLAKLVVPQVAVVHVPTHGQVRRHVVDIGFVDGTDQKHFVSVTTRRSTKKLRRLAELDEFLHQLGFTHRIAEPLPVAVCNNLDELRIRRRWLPEFAEWEDAVVEMTSASRCTLRYLRDLAPGSETDREWMFLTAFHLLAHKRLVPEHGLEVPIGPDTVVLPAVEVAA